MGQDCAVNINCLSTSSEVPKDDFDNQQKCLAEIQAILDKYNMTIEVINEVKVVQN